MTNKSSRSEVDKQPCDRTFEGASTFRLKDGVIYCPRCGFAAKEHPNYPSETKDSQEAGDEIS